MKLGVGEEGNLSSSRILQNGFLVNVGGRVVKKSCPKTKSKLESLWMSSSYSNRTERGVTEAQEDDTQVQRVRRERGEATVE
jgi:hypothetical protein